MRNSLLLGLGLMVGILTGPLFAQGSENGKYPPLPVGVSSFGAAEDGKYAYVYGGHAGQAHSYSTETAQGKFYRLDLANPKSWEELAGGPGMQGLALVAHKGKLIRIGGMQPRNQPGEEADTHSIASCASYDPATNKWTDLPDLPAPRSSHDAVVVGDKVVVVGGWTMKGKGNESDWQTTALVLDMAKEPLEWKEIKQPIERRAWIAVPVGNKVLALGGLNAVGSIELTSNFLDLEKETWEKGPELPAGPMNGFSPAVAINGNRVILSTGDGKLHELNADMSSWKEIGKLATPRMVHRLVNIKEGSILVLGGSSRKGPVAETEVIVLP